MSTEVASAFVTLIPSAKGFGKQLDREISGDLDRSGREGGKRFGKGFSGGASSVIKGVAALAAGGAVVGFLKDSVSQASDLNEAGTKLQAIFGSASADVQKFAAGGAKQLGQSKLAVLDSAASFGTFGKAAGLGGKDLAKFSTGFAGLATDLSSFFNTSPADAAEAISSGLRGEAEPLRKYGVLLDDATLRGEAMRLGLIKTTKTALTPQQKVLAAQAVIYKQTKDAQGDFGRTSGGLANQQRILSAQVTDLKGRIGAGLLPVITKVVTFANTKLLPALSRTQKFVKSNATTFKILGAVIGGIAAAFLIYTGTVKVVTAVTKAYAVAQMILNGAMALNPIGIIVVAVIALGVALVVAYKKSETFRNFVTGAFKAIGAAASFMWEGVIRPVFKFIVGAWLKVVGAMVNGAAAAFGWVPFLGGKLKAAAKKFNSFRDDVNASLDGIDSHKSIVVEARLVTFGRVGHAGRQDVVAQASGGPQFAGRAYLTSEQGPELIVPKRDGHTFTHAQTNALLDVATGRGGGAGGGLTVQITNPVPEPASTSIAKARQVAHLLEV